jgi:CubicO group peptidase (beta-lactamase class C family)
VAGLLVLAACSGGDAGDVAVTATTRSVGDGSLTTELAPTSSDAPSTDDRFAALAAAVEEAGANCLVVERAGKTVGEWYWQGFGAGSLQEGFSTTKSVAATLVGIAADQGHLALDQPASDFIDEWQGTASESVTIRQLLSNTSGRFHDVVTDYAQLAFLEQDKSTFAVSLGQQVDPGTRWVYNNAAVQTLEVVLERSTGMPVATFASRNLFEPLGMTSRLSLDGAGNAGLFAGMQTNCRDLATLARLYLDDGSADGRTVVSPAFVDEALTSSSPLNEAYGYLWWLNRTGTVQSTAEGSTRRGASLLAALDEDVFWASGACGQVAMAIPTIDLVVAVMRPVAAGSITALAECGAVDMEGVLAGALAELVPELGQ